MSRKRSWAWFFPVWCAVWAVLNLALGARTDNPVSYVGAVAMAALFFLDVRNKQMRKAANAVATFPNPNDQMAQIQKQIREMALRGPSWTSGPISFHTSPVPSPPRQGKASEFKGLPFDLAIGEVYGLRMWKMDAYGRLRARNWDTAPPWRPGVNIAKCIETPEQYAYQYSFGPRTPKPPHQTPSEDCKCGFYAYTSEMHAETQSYAEHNVILGVVKGTGRTLVGTQGFRCEKAEIVALRDPTRGGEKTDLVLRTQLANLNRVYPDIPLFSSRAALLEFAPLTDTLPDPTSDEFWEMA